MAVGAAAAYGLTGLGAAAATLPTSAAAEGTEGKEGTDGAEGRSAERVEASPGGWGWHGLGLGPLALDTAASTLGLTEEELLTALTDDGDTLAEVAAAQGVGTQVLVDALVAAAVERLGEEVAEGDLTQDQADALEAELPDRVAAAVEGERPWGRHGGPALRERGA